MALAISCCVVVSSLTGVRIFAPVGELIGDALIKWRPVGFNDPVYTAVLLVAFFALSVLPGAVVGALIASGARPNPKSGYCTCGYNFIGAASDTFAECRRPLDG